MFRVFYLLPTLLCIGCSSLPHRTILITDSKGRPIPRANVSPYPILIRNFFPASTGNSADSRGRIALYDVIPGGNYDLSAPGFVTRSIAFPQHNNASYSLKTANYVTQ